MITIKQVTLLKHLLFFILMNVSLQVYSQPRIKLKVDKNHELIFALMMQSTMESIVAERGILPWSMITAMDSPLKASYAELLSADAGHTCIRSFNQLIEQGFVGFSPINVISQLDEYLHGNTACWFESTNLPAYTREPITKFLEQLRQFENEIGFRELYASHQPVYIEMIRNQEAVVNVERLIHNLEDFFDYQFKTYHISLVPLMWAGGMAIPIIADCDSGELEPYILIGPKSLEKGIPSFGDKESYSALIYHEMSHLFLRPYLEDYQQEIEQYSFLFKEKYAELGYLNWQAVFDETLTRVCEVVLTYRDNQELIETQINKQAKMQGFELMPLLYATLKECYIDNKSGTSFQAVFPYVLQSLEQAIV